MSKKKWCGLLAVLMAVSIVFTSGALRPVNVYAETCLLYTSPSPRDTR